VSEVCQKTPAKARRSAKKALNKVMKKALNKAMKKVIKD
jgi:HD superfamily phosphohydrolase YqeK